jgi:hypothetical protein
MPTGLAALPCLLAYTQQLDLRRWLDRPKRGIPTLVLAVWWLVLSWRGSGRPAHGALLDEPLLLGVLGQEQRPNSSPLLRSLRYFSAHDLRHAVQTSYTATLEQRSGRIWVSLDSHQIPYYGRQQRDQFQRGWAGQHGRALRGYRLYLAVDTATGQSITFLLVRGGARDATVGPILARHVRRLLGKRLAGVLGDCGFTTRATLAAMRELGIPFIFGFGRVAQVKARLQALSRQQRVALRDGGAIRLGDCPWDARLRLFAVGARAPTDHRGPWVYVTSLRSCGPRKLASLYRRRGRVEQTIDELSNGHDLNHLVSYRLHPNRIAVGFRLLARNLAIGQQLDAATDAPTVIREPLAFRTTHVDGLGIFTAVRRTVLVLPLHRAFPEKFTLKWTRRVVKLAS